MEPLFDVILTYVNNPGRGGTHLPAGLPDVLKTLPLDVASRLTMYVSDAMMSEAIYPRRLGAPAGPKCGPMGALYTALIAAHPGMRLETPAVICMLDCQSTTRQQELVKALSMSMVRQLALDIPDDHELMGYVARRAKKLMKEADELDPKDESDATIIERAKPKKKE